MAGGGRVQVGAVDVAYGVEGAGPPYVLVHGSTGSRAQWAPVVPGLADRFTVVLPEYAGSGETADGGGRLEVADLADQVVGAAGAAGADRFALAGWSLGAVVATAVAARHPDRVESLALVCGWARTDARMRFTFGLWQALLAADRELFARYALADGLTAGSFEVFGDSADGLVPATAEALAPGSDRHAELDARVDLTDLLPAVTAPTLVVGGREDRWVPIEHSRELAGAIRGARLVELDCGHLVPAERGAELAQLLVDHAAAAT